MKNFFRLIATTFLAWASLVTFPRVYAQNPNQIPLNQPQTQNLVNIFQVAPGQFFYWWWLVPLVLMVFLFLVLIFKEDGRERNFRQEIIHHDIKEEEDEEDKEEKEAIKKSRT